MLVVAALGRSALAAPDAIGLEARVRDIAQGLAPVARTHRLVVLHAGGAHSSAVGVHAHLLGRELQNVLPGLRVASLVGHCIVAQAQPGQHPLRLAEIEVVRRLLGDVDTVPCIGAIPVRLDSHGEMVAAGPSFDGDEAAATVATELGADVLLLLADTEAVYRDWPERLRPIPRMDARAPEAVPAGIARKVEAACAFAQTRDTFAVIGRADRGAALLAGRSGTCVVAGS
jgi:carbamate kinase